MGLDGLAFATMLHFNTSCPLVPSSSRKVSRLSAGLESRVSTTIHGIVKRRRVPTALDTADSFHVDAETFDPLVPRVAQQAMTRSPILLPWQPRILPLGMFFQSAATQSPSPFAPQSAFDAASLDSARVVFTANDGRCSFRSSEAMSSSASSDYLSVSIGAAVNIVCLEASVLMHYDRAVMDNRDLNKASVIASYCAGSVGFARPPELLEDAFELLYTRGVDAFKTVFGDYYVGGY